MSVLRDPPTGEPWRVGTHGLPGWDARRDPLWTAPMRGVRLSVLADEADPRTRALVAATALNGIPLGGWAAAHLLGAGDLDGRTGRHTLLPVPVCPGDSGRCRRRDGLDPWRSAITDEDVVQVGGVAVTSPVRTAFDLARRAGDLRFAVADLDAMLRAGCGLRAQDVADYAEQRPRWQGAAQAERAAALAHPGARSRPESWMRMVWILDAHLPAPLVNPPVYVGTDTLLGYPDMLDEATGLCGEFDGAHHRTAAQQHADAVRAEQMAGAALTFVRAGAPDIGHPLLLAHRMRQGEARARDTPRGPWWVPLSARRRA